MEPFGMALQTVANPFRIEEANVAHPTTVDGASKQFRDAADTNTQQYNHNHEVDKCYNFKLETIRYIHSKNPP
jgi:hypothetical protein